MAEDKAVEARTLEFLSEWERSKPTDGATRPEDALARLQAMESRYTRLKDERDNVAKAREALELHDTGKFSGLIHYRFEAVHFIAKRHFSNYHSYVYHFVIAYCQMVSAASAQWV